GATLKEAGFRQRFNAVVLAVKKRERIFLRRIGNLRLEHGDTLLISAERATIETLKQNPDFIIAEELEVTKFRRGKIPMVMAILTAVIAAATFQVLPISVAALSGVVAMVVTGCLKVNELHDSIRWDIVFLLAGVIPLGVALSETGAAALLAQWIVAQSQGLPPILIMGIFYVLTLLTTQIISNNASVALMIPIAVSSAETLGLNPLSFILACTFAASMGFLSPIGYQTNLMVYGPGEYKFSDFMRVGLPLSVLMTVVTVLLIQVFWPLGAT
ncbi:MAG: SLC13 family permease, partial [Candidatus Thermoplasmatota archaeon]|nr:SLC13 family permease [Candidatus Thermoplasmatota archaeon]